MASNSGAEHRLHSRILLAPLLVLPWIVLWMGCGGEDPVRVAYDQRIRGEIRVPPGYEEQILVEAENFDEDTPYVNARVTADENGHFDMFVPEGEYRVSVVLPNSTTYYGNRRSRALAAQATPVSTGPGIETEFVSMSLGSAVLELELPSPAAGWDLTASLVNPVLRSRICRAEQSTVSQNVLRLTFPPVALDDYSVELQLENVESRAYDRTLVPVEIGGRTVPTLSIPEVDVVGGRIEVSNEVRILGDYLGPESELPGARLFLTLWDRDNEVSYVRSVSIDLTETTEFEVQLLFQREMLLQWEVNLPGEDNDQTNRWLGAWTRGPSTPVVPSTQPERLRLESIGLLVDLARPEDPVPYAGWLEVQDGSGQTRGAYYTDDRNDYQGPVFFSNLPPALYYLHFRPNLNVPRLDQWYADELALSFGEATAIDARTPGARVDVEWNAFIGGSISGTATLEDGSVAASSWILLARESSNVFENRIRTDESGRYHVVGLTNGRYRIGVARRNTSQITWYPRTATLAEAELIEIAGYGALDGYDIQLLPL